METRSAAARQWLREWVRSAPVAFRSRSISIIRLLFIVATAAVPAPAAAGVFGTGTGFDQGFYSGFTGVTEGVALQQIVNGRAEIDATSTTSFGVARARANALPQEFSLGAAADSIGNSFQRSAWAFAKTDFDLSGGPGAFTLHFTIEGDIPLTANTSRQTASFAFYVHGLDDSSGGALGRVDGALQEDGTRYISIDHNAQVFGEGESFQTVTGSHILAGLRVTIPAGTTSIIAMMQASSNNAAIDFIGTAKLTGVELPPGSTLTLGTGQVVPVVPEPAAIALVMAPFIAALCSRRRRARRASLTT